MQDQARQSCFLWELCKCFSEHRAQLHVAKKSTSWHSSSNFWLPKVLAGQNSWLFPRLPSHAVNKTLTGTSVSLSWFWDTPATPSPVFIGSSKCSACPKAGKVVPTRTHVVHHTAMGCDHTHFRHITTCPVQNTYIVFFSRFCKFPLMLLYVADRVFKSASIWVTC